MSEWRPIESAPEYEDVLLCLPRYGVAHDMPVMAVGELADGKWYSDASHKEEYELYAPTAWMPLPSPPKDDVMTDPMERLIADALDAAGIGYVTDQGGGNPSNLDFRLDNGVEIEVKRFHSPRISEQMARADNVIVAQGEQAIRFLAGLLASPNPHP